MINISVISETEGRGPARARTCWMGQTKGCGYERKVVVIEPLLRLYASALVCMPAGEEVWD